MISYVSGPLNGIYPTGSTLTFLVTYDTAVNVSTTDGTPTLGLVGGNLSGAVATYAGGSGSNTLIFQYTVGASDSAPNGVGVVSPIVLNGGTIQDNAGTNAGLTFVAQNFSGAVLNYTSATDCLHRDRQQ